MGVDEISERTEKAQDQTCRNSNTECPSKQDEPAETLKQVSEK